MSRAERPDLLSQVQVGDVVQYGRSDTGHYEIVSMTHSRYGDSHLALRQIHMGHHGHGSEFEYRKTAFNGDFHTILHTADQRLKSECARSLYFLGRTGRVDDVHELLVKVEI